VAHVFLKAEKIVSQGLGMLQRDIVLPRLVTRYNASDFIGAKNDTVTVKIPAILTGREYEWRTRNADIEYDDLEELSIPLTLNKHVYSAVQITDEQMTLDIVSWGVQVATPQIRAVAEVLEGYIATAMEGANYRTEIAWEQGDPESDTDRSFYRAAVAARKALNDANVPKDGRVLLLGSNLEEAALLSPHLIKVDQAGSDGVLRDAIIGRIAGFTVVSTNSIDPDFGVAYHPTAFAFANLAPVVPQGASAGAVGTFDGLAMRWIRDYDPNRLRDRSVYSSFAAAMSIEDGRDLESPVGSGFGELTDENVRAVKINFTAFT
jgi:hypothetical protein